MTRIKYQLIPNEGQTQNLKVQNGYFYDKTLKLVLFGLFLFFLFLYVSTPQNNSIDVGNARIQKTDLSANSNLEWNMLYMAKDFTKETLELSVQNASDTTINYNPLSTAIETTTSTTEMSSSIEAFDRSSSLDDISSIAPTTKASPRYEFSTTSANNHNTSATKTYANLVRYFVKTATCEMPYIDPWTSDVRKIYKRQSFYKCSKDADLVTSTFDKTKRRYALHLNGNQTEISCCYQQIVRTGSGNNVDKSFKALPCSLFHQDFIVPEHIDAVVVECKSEKSGKMIQNSAFSFVQNKVPKSNADTVTPKPSINTRKPSVLMIGIDSLSRINFRRTMPETFQYLTEDKWFELEGYNKMGDNTFPNLMAVLTGRDSANAYAKCNPKVVGGLDKCTFIWNEYHKNGYQTAYAEDWISFSTFNYNKKGFQKQPTDYYLRPLTLAIERMLTVKKEAGIPYCLGQRHYAEYIYDYAMQLANFYANREPYFGFFWTNSFSHNDFAKPSSMDTRMLEYFRQMKRDGILDEAIVIFFSDHGMRFGTLRKLSNGFLEERWPMFFISLPPWFQEAHKDFVSALNTNKNRLTSPFDIFVTLNHILELGNTSSIVKYAPPQGCAKCQSIFEVVPENRTCMDAGISEHWCACSSYERISIKDAQVVNVAKLVTNEINKYLSDKNVTSICSTLQVDKIVEAEHKEISKTNKLFYRIKFDVNPKGRSFETTLEYDVKAKKVEVDVESISCLSSYENDSKCTQLNKAKKYCICKH